MLSLLFSLMTLIQGSHRQKLTYFHKIQRLEAPWLSSRCELWFEQFGSNPRMVEIALVTRKNSEGAILHSASQLKGHVTLRTPADALQYARILTNWCSFQEILPPGALEVIRKSALGDTVIGPDKKEFERLREEPNGFEGILNAATADRIKCDPVVRRTPRGFRLSRVLLWTYRPRNKHRVMIVRRVTETIGRQGEYDVVKGEQVYAPEIYLPNRL